jgi:hypothetical protein
VAILRVAHYKGYITQYFEPVHFKDEAQIALFKEPVLSA